VCDVGFEVEDRKQLAETAGGHPGAMKGGHVALFNRL
jgi:hypothetical protein